MNADIIIVGGGASGLAAAIESKKICTNSRIVIVERLDRVGRKILATGGGKCNLGNSHLGAEYYHGSIQPIEIIRKSISTEKFFSNIGVLCTEDIEGRMYPRSNSAATVLNALRLKAESLGIEEKCGFEMKNFMKHKNQIKIYSEQGEEIYCKRLIIAAGGYAAPSFGTDGGVLRLLKNKGYKIAKICPSVAPLNVRADLLKGLKGIRVKGKISAVCNGMTLKEQVGEIQFTENTISGICVFNLAYLFGKYGEKLVLRADFLPDMKEKDVKEYLLFIYQGRKNCNLEELLTGMLVKNLAIYITKRVLNRPLTDKISTLSDDEIRNIAKAVKCFEFPISGCSSWKNAQCTYGGVHVDCIDENLESKIDRGVYLCGEILDVSGDCGGYNLKWAWASGNWAARNCANSINGGKL